ncbi:SCO family protein [Nocardioides jensenii]|uniref:SCO family protein n=1 Tax=Nocardioides jensenii TaxID=1843 RepID=UPI000AF525BB|nr:SCO family protein [Nocardioides jensenii]
MQRRVLAAAAVTAALVLTGCASGSEPVGEEGFHGTALKDKYAAPVPALTDTDGLAYSLAKQTGKPLTLVFFGYTNCPDICQMVMSNIASSLTRLDDDLRDEVEVVFVTTDPARDDEKALRTYLDRFDEDFVGLTGKLSTIADLATSFGVFMGREPKLPTGGYDVTHTTHVFSIDANDEVPVVWNQDTSAADLADDLTTLLKEDS